MLFLVNSFIFSIVITHYNKYLVVTYIFEKLCFTFALTLMSPAISFEIGFE